MQTIERTFTILKTIAAAPNGIGVTQIAVQTKLPKGTVSRFLTALEAETAVHRSPNNLFTIGKQVEALLRQPTFNELLIAQARPILTAINQATQEAVGLSILAGHTITYIDHRVSTHSVQVADWTGRSAPLHATSAGKLFLAHSPDSFVDDYLTRPLNKLTPHTITDPNQLRDTLVSIRTAGYATTDEEFADGVIGYSIPLMNSQQTPIAAITLYGPKYRFDPANESALIADLKKHAKQLKRHS